MSSLRSVRVALTSLALTGCEGLQLPRGGIAPRRHGRPQTAYDLQVQERAIERDMWERMKQSQDPLDKLFYAAHTGDAKTAKEVLKSHSSLATRGRLAFQRLAFHNQTALSIAAEAGQTNVVKVFTEAGLPLDEPDNLGYTPLFHAAFEGHVSTVKELVEKGADKSSADKSKADLEGNTPLHAAAYAGKPKIVKVLADAYTKEELKDAIEKSNNNGKTPLVLAVEQSRYYTVKAFLELAEECGAWLEIQKAYEVSSAMPFSLSLTRLLVQGEIDRKFQDMFGA